MTEVTASAYASHGQGRIYSRKTLALSLAHEGGPLTAMSVGGARVDVLAQALESGYTSFQPSLSHAWDAVWTPGSQQAPSQQVVVAGGSGSYRRGQPLGRQPRENGYSCSHEASGISVGDPEV